MLIRKNYDLLVQYRQARKSPQGEQAQQFQRFIDLRWVMVASSSCEQFSPDEFFMRPQTWIISPEGEHQLSAYEDKMEKIKKERTEQEADRKNQHKFDLVLAVSSALLGSLLTLLIEHLGKIRDLLVAVVG